MGNVSTDWHLLSADEALDKLKVAANAGLDSADVQQRRQQYGKNELDEGDQIPAWRVFLGQFADYMQIMLLAAGGVSIFIGQYSTAFILILLTIVNALLGYRQEAKAEASVAALKEMLQVMARVMRGGKRVEVSAEELVPGDIVFIEAGDLVPADGRLIRAATLEIEESALTGESQPVMKGVAAIAGKDVPLGDRVNVVYMNSLVTRGAGTFVVTATGMETEVGHIADMLSSVETDKSPLQKQIDNLTKVLGYIAIAAVAFMMLAGFARGFAGDELFFLAVAMAVAAIPTGLPTIVTALLSLGTQQLARDNAIVKNLTSVETLGSTSAICSDKTGTLTLNKMTATTLFYGGNQYKISGVGYSDIGQIQYVAGVGDVPLEPALLPMALASDATVDGDELVGDPTEGALVTLAAKGGLNVSGTRDLYPRLAEVPFDSAYKYMATFHHMTGADGKPVVRCYVKGAPDVVAGLSHDVNWENDEKLPMSRVHSAVMEANSRLAGDGLRVLALAMKDIDSAEFDPDANLFDLVSDLTLLALVGIVDPPRPEARDAIAKAQSAGIKVRMITGDHVVTAGAIGHQLGITGDAMAGADLNTMADEALLDRIDSIGIIGRVAPEHKVRIVETLQQKGAITAMTGDGVNDAPALKTADIGIAMGITGTEVSKQAATMILTDDNFATIVKAVELGRAIYDNLLKYLRFQLITLVGYIVLFVGSMALNVAMGAPLNPLQILWLNFLIDVPLAMGLGRDTPAPDLMQRQPRKSDAPIITPRLRNKMLIVGTILAIATLLAPYLAGVGLIGTLGAVAGTMVLTTISLTHVFIALESRSETRSVFDSADFPTSTFIIPMVISLTLMVLVTEAGFLQRWFSTTSLSVGQWVLCIVCAALTLVAMEGMKWVYRRQAA